MIQFKENAQTGGRKDGQTLFYRTLLATAEGPKRKAISPFFDKSINLMHQVNTCVEWRNWDVENHLTGKKVSSCCSKLLCEVALTNKNMIKKYMIIL